MISAEQKQPLINTENILAEMLKENTGQHMLDSGGHYGRHWQRNLARNFSTEESNTLSFKWGEISLSYSLFHWLSEKVEYNKLLNDRVLSFSEKEENKDRSGLLVMELFLKDEIKNDAMNWEICNSYNYDNLLDQTIQYLYWVDDDGPHVLLQIHGGCDVRGGYTKPKAFDLFEEDALNFSEGRIWCSNQDCGLHWYTDDAYHWYSEDFGGRQLETYDIVNHDDEYYYADDGGGVTRPEPGKGYIFVDTDGNGHCPCCGNKLVA